MSLKKTTKQKKKPTTVFMIYIFTKIKFFKLQKMCGIFKADLQVIFERVILCSNVSDLYYGYK